MLLWFVVWLKLKIARILVSTLVQLSECSTPMSCKRRIGVMWRLSSSRFATLWLVFRVVKGGNIFYPRVTLTMFLNQEDATEFTRRDPLFSRKETWAHKKKRDKNFKMCRKTSRLRLYLKRQTMIFFCANPKAKFC